MKILLAAATDRGRRRKKNEDQAAAGSFEVNGLPACLLAVADGVGGAPAGARASELALRSVEAWIPDLPSANSLTAVFEEANHRINDDASDDPSRHGMATTLVVALVVDTRLWVANVGDSRAYLVRDARAQQISRDHSLVAERVRAGMITEAEAEHSQQRNVITRSLGTAEQPEVDLFDCGRLGMGDAVVLCSDGLYGMVSEDEIANCATSLEPDAAVRELIRRANQAGGDDNIAVAIARLTGLDVNSVGGNGLAD